jgi:heme/copper-type cytochrome/quinol oxidase subunit 1
MLILSRIFCLLTIFGLLVICYDGDLTDNYDPPVFLLQLPIIITFVYSEVTLIQLITESINFPLINMDPFLIRSPPTRSLERFYYHI